MGNYKILYIILYKIILGIVLVFSIFQWNLYKITPSTAEIKFLNKTYGSLMKINNLTDFIKLQNKIIDEIANESNGIGEIDISQIISTGNGSCFHRSLILQKILIYNNILIRPVYLYYNPTSSNTHAFEIFGEVNSHNIFEFYYQGTWYVMRTNSKMEKFETLEVYIKNQTLFPHKRLRYCRYLNNRNGRFISPGFVPDIYGNFVF